MAFVNPLSHRRRTSSEDGAVEPQDASADYMKAFGRYLRGLRLDAGVTQQSLANTMGIYHSAVSSIERGKSSIPPERLEHYANELGVDPTEFAKTYLRYMNVWAYRLIFEPNNKKLTKEVQNIQTRVGKDVFKPKRR